jgi:hypothetical protein
MIRAFQDWFHKNRSLLDDRHITVDISKPTEDLSKNSIYADLRTDRSEATVQVWESGESDFHFLSSPSADEVIVTHHDFESSEQLDAALHQLIEQMS